MFAQAAFEYVEERVGAATPAITPTTTGAAGGSAALPAAAACACSAGACTCRRNTPTQQPALVFVHAGLYQEECLTIDTDVQLIGR